MYLIFSKNNPYLGELNKSPLDQNFQKEFEGMEIDLKNRFKTKEIDIKDNFMSNNFSDNISDEENTSNEDSISLMSTKLKSSHIGINEEEIQEKKKDKIKKQLKYYIHILNIISSIIILISQLCSHIENEIYYLENRYIRGIGGLILNLFDFKENNKSHAWEKLFNDNNLNLSLMIEKNGNFLPTLITHYISNNFTYTKIINKDILETYNITLDLYSLERVFYYKNMKIPLIISDSCNKLRYFILAESFTSMLFLCASRYLSFYRENKILKNNSIPFYKSKYCLILFFEVLFLLFFQYPYLNYILIFQQLDRKMILPLSSLLSAISNFRLIYFFQLINSLSIYDSSLSEKILDKFYLAPNIIFTMKSYQKNNPFITLTILFIISWICFALTIRIFEMHYWETFKIIPQDWSFIWNSLWCIFVSMTTVGYGDFYPRTHFGRIIIIFSCVVGIYFTSIMMVFLTKKSLLNENETKSYKLITRLRIKNELKDIYSNIIYHSIKIVIVENKYFFDNISQKKYEIDYNFERRNVILNIDKKKYLSEKIKSFDIIPTKDQLYDIAERIIDDIKDINNEVKLLQKLNNSFLGYTDTQVVMIKYLKKCIQNTKLMLDLIEKKPKSFGELANFNKENLIESMNKIYNEHKKESINMTNLKLNKNLELEKLFEDSKIINPNLVHYDEFFSNELAKYNVTQEEYKQFFYSLFFKSSSFGSLKHNSLKAMKTIKQMKELKKNIDGEYMQKRNYTHENSLVYIKDDMK